MKLVVGIETLLTRPNLSTSTTYGTNLLFPARVRAPMVAIAATQREANPIDFHILVCWMYPPYRSFHSARLLMYGFGLGSCLDGLGILLDLLADLSRWDHFRASLLRLGEGIFVC